ncbi:hypothetical protein Tco_1366845 [Tanacetum coccineum]
MFFYSSAVAFAYKQVIPQEGTMFFKSKLYTSSFLGALKKRLNLSSVGKQLANLYEAKSLDSSGSREVTRSLVSWLMSGYEGLAFIEATSALALTFACSSSFTFRNMSSAPDSSFALEVVWAVFNPSPADLVLSTRTLGLDPARADIPGSASAVKSIEASCPDADLECKMKEVDQADVGPPAACCATLCISPTTSVGSEGWLRLVSMAELDLVSFFEWPDWDLDASVVDSNVCFEDYFLLSPLLAPGFLPWGTSLVGEEYLGALESTGTSRLQMAFMWSVNGGSSGWFVFSIQL